MSVDAGLTVSQPFAYFTALAWHPNGILAADRDCLEALRGIDEDNISAASLCELQSLIWTYAFQSRLLADWTFQLDAFKGRSRLINRTTNDMSGRV